MMSCNVKKRLKAEQRMFLYLEKEFAKAIEHSMKSSFFMADRLCHAFIYNLPHTLEVDRHILEKVYDGPFETI